MTKYGGRKLATEGKGCGLSDTCFYLLCSDYDCVRKWVVVCIPLDLCKQI